MSGLPVITWWRSPRVPTYAPGDRARAAVRVAHRGTGCADSQYRFPRVFEQPVELVKDHTFRQMFIEDLGHEEATILLTNDRRGAAAVITRYAQRMLIENALSDAVRFFHLDALSSAVGLKVDFDMALLVIASGLYRLLARTMRGYADAQARQIFRDLIDMPATVEVTKKEVIVQDTEVASPALKSSPGGS